MAIAECTKCYTIFHAYISVNLIYVRLNILKIYITISNLFLTKNSANLFCGKKILMKHSPFFNLKVRLVTTIGVKKRNIGFLRRERLLNKCACDENHRRFFLIIIIINFLAGRI